MIRLKAVTKIYNDGRPNCRIAVEGVSLELFDRHITVLQGPSGSGKTTLLSLIGAMTRPTSGRIFFGKTEITSLPERFLTELRRSQVGFIFQNYNLLKGISVLQNVVLPAIPEGDRFDVLCRRAMALLAQLEISQLVDLPVQHLSGGEQQRVAIARALINQPQLLIADEPTAHLDSKLSEQFMTIAADLRNQGKSVLIASHDPLVCRHRSVDAVLPIHDGRLASGILQE